MSANPHPATTPTYSAWVTDSRGRRLYTTSGHATRQEAIDQAWARYPGADGVASGAGTSGWEGVQFQTAVARRAQTGAPEPTDRAWDGSEPTVSVVSVVNVGTPLAPATRLTVDGVIVARGSTVELESLRAELVESPEKARILRDAFRKKA